MFGSDPDKNTSNPQPSTNGAPPVISPAAPALGSGTPTPDSVAVPAPNTSIAPSSAVSVDSAPSYLDSGAPPAASAGSNTASNSFIATGTGAPSVSSGPGSLPVPAATPPAVPDELMKIKQDALHNLAPLIDKLDQPPEERFKTLMMMIQASDNSEYLDEAYAAANGITDEKEKAQALLDVVNEINYFTQNSKQEPKA